MADNITAADPVGEIAERALNKTSIVDIDGWDGSTARHIFVAPYDCHVDAFLLVSGTGVAASDTNYYSFQVENSSAAENLLSEPQTTRLTDGAGIEAGVPYDIEPDQNRVLLKGDVLTLDVTESGTATDLTSVQLLAVVEYT